MEARLTKCPKACLRKDGQRCRDTVQNTFDISVDHILPIVDAQIVERRDRHNAGIVDENIKLAVALTCQLDKVGQIVTPADIFASVRGFTAHIRDASRQSLEAIRSARAEYELCTTISEKERSRLANSAACAGDDDDLVFNSGHEVLLFQSVTLPARSGGVTCAI